MEIFEALPPEKFLCFTLSIFFKKIIRYQYLFDSSPPTLLCSRYSTNKPYFNCCLFHFKMHCYVLQPNYFLCNAGKLPVNYSGFNIYLKQKKHIIQLSLQEQTFTHGIILYCTASTKCTHFCIFHYKFYL